MILNHNCILQPLKEMLGTLMPGLHPGSSDLIGLERSAEYNNFFWKHSGIFLVQPGLATINIRDYWNYESR